MSGKKSADVIRYKESLKYFNNETNNYFWYRLTENKEYLRVSVIIFEKDFANNYDFKTERE